MVVVFTRTSQDHVVNKRSTNLSNSSCPLVICLYLILMHVVEVSNLVAFLERALHGTKLTSSLLKLKCLIHSVDLPTNFRLC